MSKTLKIVIGVVVLFAVGFGAVFVLANTILQDDGNESTATNQFTSQFAKDCEKKDVSFTDWPIAPSDLRAIIPMGTVAHEHVDPVEHVYNVSNAKDATPSVPVVMPADGYIIAAWSLAGLETNNGGNGPRIDIGLQLQFSCQYFARVLHIYELAPELESQLSNLPVGENKYVRIHLGAGQRIGMVGASSDYSLQDTTTDPRSKAFINSDRYAGDAVYLYDIDPFSVYPTDLRQTLEALSTRIVAPKGGRYDYDVPATALGSFFRVDGYGIVGSKQQMNGPQFWKYTLSLIPYWNDPSLSMLSTGHWRSEADANQFFTVESVDFAKIGVGQSVTVGLVEANSFDRTTLVTRSQIQSAPIVGSAVIRVDGGEKITVQLLPGVPPAQAKGFTGAEEHYDRS